MEEYEKIAGWSDDLLSIVNPTPETMQGFVRAAEEIDDYLAPLIAEKRKKPGADLLSALIEAENEGDITGSDMRDITCSIITGSTDTTTTQMCLNLETLQAHPAAREQLRDHPEMLSGAVLELMRFRPGMLSLLRMPSLSSGANLSRTRSSSSNSLRPRAQTLRYPHGCRAPTSILSPKMA